MMHSDIGWIEFPTAKVQSAPSGTVQKHCADALFKLFVILSQIQRPILSHEDSSVTRSIITIEFAEGKVTETSLNIINEY